MQTEGVSPKSVHQWPGPSDTSAPTTQEAWKAVAWQVHLQFALARSPDVRYRDLQPGWARVPTTSRPSFCGRSALGCTPGAEQGRPVEPDHARPCSWRTYTGPCETGCSHASLIRGFPGTARRARQAFQWGLASGELATLFRSGLDPGSPVRAPEVLACGQAYPYTAHTQMDPREPDAQSARYVPALFTPEPEEVGTGEFHCVW